MAKRADKKIFFVNGTEYTLVMGKRWYVEYYVELPAGCRDRRRTYDPLNRIKDFGLREAKALEIIEGLAISGNRVSLVSDTLVAVKADYRLKTYQSYTSRVKYYLEWLGSTPDTIVTKAQAGQFLRDLRLKGRAPATVASYQRTLSSMYNQAGLVNPFEHMKPRLVQSKSLMWFKDWQVTAIIDKARSCGRGMYLAILLQFYCYIRPGELRLLEVDDINLEGGYIEIRAEISKNKKTQKVTIPDALRPELEAAPAMTGRGLLFKSTWGKKAGGPVGKNFFNRHHSDILNVLEIEGRYAFYSWKHTGVVKAVRAGINLKDLQLQLRHHSLDQVNEYLKDLGVLDSEDLRTRFPAICVVGQPLPHLH